MALFRLFMFFSWFELGSMVFVAFPVHTSCFVPGSYISRTRVPILMVELVAEPIPPPKPRPVPQAFPLPFLVHSDLITDVKVGLLTVSLGHTLGSQLRVNGLLDFSVHDLIGVGSAFNSNPLVGVI